MASACKVMLIAFDAAEMDLLLRWSDSGDLPNLKRLRDSGAWGRTTPPPATGNDCMWFTLLSGVNPGRHGRYFGLQVFPGSYKVRHFSNDDVTCEPFWMQLGRAGQRVAVVDLPYAPFMGEVNGVQVSDWLMHAPMLEEPLSWPPALIDDLIREFGSNPIGHCDRFESAGDRCLELQQILHKRIEMKAAAATKILDQGGWDLFMTSFADSHCVGHQSWHLHNPSHPDYDADWVLRHGDPVREVYRALDSALGRLLERAGPETIVVFLAGPGMQGNYGANFLLDRVLRHLENGKVRSKRAAVDSLQWAWRKIPSRLRFKARRFSDGFLSSERSQRRCFAVPHNEVSGAIRINLAGREADGLVQAGTEYDELCDALTEDLLALVNLDTGRPAVLDVIKTHDCMAGERLDDLPDLLVSWNREAPIRRLGSPKIGEIGGAYPGVRTGDHTSNVMFMVKGPDIAAGRTADVSRIEDFAPTIAAYLGISLADVEGRPIEALMPRTSAGSPAHNTAER